MGGAPHASTQEFVRFAEAAGLSRELDQAVLDEALAVLGKTPWVALAVNLSGLSLQDPAFCGYLLARVREASVLCARLLVEVTETAEIENVATARSTLAALREAGVPVGLDDFGAGAAAFRYLRDFRVDFIKIDGTYLRAALRSPRAHAMLGSMVSLAQGASAQVVVEMIETEEQEALCRAIGADLGQGWLYGKPGRLPG
jgi:EAL domain-containing protein (putative c-di-GMP-specific phosphodiesterase class I)